jgi:hypothetical protein
MPSLPKYLPPQRWAAKPFNFGLRVSAFGFLSAFGFRPSDFLPLCALCVLCGSSTAHAQFRPPEVISARSYSGQFIIRAGVAPAARPLNLETNRNCVRLDPALLPISCERIKQILWRQLGATAPWSGKIFLSLYPARSADDVCFITSAQFRDGWQYQVELPDVADRARYVRAMVQVLLLEMANRTAGAHSAEIPTWLIEGFSEQLLASSQMAIILPPPGASSTGISIIPAFLNARREDPLTAAHERLSTHPPLTFEQLSWPAADQLAGEAGEVYRSSAQLFVNGLLRLNDGRACLRAMIEELPQHYNWQFAFLHAFRACFQRPLDVEKWWALQVLHFTGRDLAQTWPAEESWQKLDQLIHSPVQVRAGTNDLPLRAEVTLQSIIREWDQQRQAPVLVVKLRELEMLRLRVAENLVPLVDEYRRVLQAYLQDHDKPGLALPSRKKAAQRRAVEETVQQLDALDHRREASRPEEGATPGPTIQAKAEVSPEP